MNQPASEPVAPDSPRSAATDGARTAPPPSPESFLAELLAAQCATSPADAGAIVRILTSSQPQILALHPQPRPGQSRPAWLTPALALVSGTDAPTNVQIVPLEVSELQTSAAVGSLIVIPFGVASADGSRGFGVYLARGPAQGLSLVAQRLRLSSGLIETLGLRAELVQSERRAADTRRVLEAAASLGEHQRFSPAVMALLNTLAASWGASRVSLGFVRGRRVRLDAMSHTEHLVRRTRLAQDIEAAMEECADQDLEVRVPTSEGDTVIARAASQLAERHTSRDILSLPLRHQAKVIAVLTLERDNGPPFAPSDAESLRLLADLTAARLAALDRYARWAGPRLLGDLRDAGALLVGPRHTWVRLLAIAVLAGALVLTFVKGTYRVEGTFRLESSELRVVPAPFDGYLREVNVRVGDVLDAPNAPLAKLDDAELRLELASAKAELAAHEREAAVAQRERKEAEAQIARARADQSRARIDLLEHQIAKASLVAPAAGVVLSGDLERRRGSPVSTGDVLFEIAPLDSLRADMFVPEDRVADLTPGQRGELATAAFPDRRVAFTVERIDPAAELRKERNVFRARLILDQRPDWMRPGMEGLARVEIDRRPLGSIWFRRAIDWVRMKLWI